MIDHRVHPGQWFDLNSRDPVREETIFTVGTHGMVFSKLDIERAQRLYESGLSCRQVGHELGYTSSYIARRLRGAGVILRPSGRPFTSPGPDIDVNEIVELRDSGMTFPEMAAQFGVSRDLVRDRYLRATGRPRRAGR